MISEPATLLSSDPLEHNVVKVSHQGVDEL